MSSRIALPLRFVRCDLGTAGPSAISTSSRTQVLTPYKPCGLPCYAASQVSAVASVEADRGASSSSNSGADGRRLFAVHTRLSAATSAASFEASAQPRPEDPSDSLLSRVIDSSLPGCRPYVALPVLSSLLRRGGISGRTAIPAALLNQWTSRHKGLVLVTHTPSEALFLRNAAQLDLVQQTFRVVCRLPAGVASAARHYLHARQRQSNDLGAGTAGAAAAVLNPYLRAHTERQREALSVADLTYGIPLTQVAATAAAAVTQRGATTDFASVGRLPAGVRPHPLVSGGFFDVARGLLRVQGTIKCVLRVQTPLHAASQHKIEQFARLQSLFTAPARQKEGGATQPTFTTAVHDELKVASIPSHPWLRPEWQIGVSLDAPNMQSAAFANVSDDDDHPHRSLPAPRGKSLAFDFRLVSLSTARKGDTALYEVHTRGDVTADEVAAVFQAEGLSVLNDYVQDVSLANVVAEVAQRMRAAPPGLLASLPMGVQHYLRSASAEELVALPLTLVPLEDADRLCIQQALKSRRSSNAAASSALLPGQPLPHLAESDDLERMQHYVQSLSGGIDTRHPLQRLLWHAIGTFHLSNAEERNAYARVLSLTLGSGIECTSLTFPDPSLPATVKAMQHIWLTYEQQRQRHASPAAAARATRQHPLAAELHYVRRNVLDDATGLTRVPLLEDMAQAGGRAARGECSFSHAAALAVPLNTVKESTRLAKHGGAAAAAAGGLPVVSKDVPRSTAAWRQTEVPPSYTEAYNGWAAASLEMLDSEERISMAEAAAPSPWWPSPAALMERAPQRRSGARPERHDHAGAPSSAAHPHSERSAEQSGAAPTVRVFLRVEELAELSCAHCGAQGHTWQHCATRSSDAVAALEGGATLIRSSSSNGVVPSLTANTGAPPSMTATSGSFLTSVMEDESLTMVEDAATVLADQAKALTDLRAQRSRALAGDTSPSAAVVLVPNMAATQHFKAAHVLRREARKPAVHRRTMRCVYCGGHHHVTACPKLQAQDGEAAIEQAASAHRSSATTTTTTSALPPLFCIKCGSKGHVYLDCPRVPRDLHPATHCPICLQPRRNGSHDPLHCPQRVPVPAGYALSGVPHSGPSSASLLSGFARSAHPQRGSHRDENGEGRSSFNAGATSDAARSPRRHRRGSVLIADTFVDAPSRRR
ncbi:hypothetical protein ABB37_02344 [Leptomonas pyrrhocoris]|uniref:CCHC-type domain-containing protein n=1 Tax=Leptomonas pyrrhocoris TaxID=157538 RepID=A0A0M9G7M1_LEPPY|nr:hypothetical protein ABB37_02344 [Leptomonas pyrrhocoris]KPA84340.1 hypothetical protein ABB37_02344 [Leptomonas pyrrhocoris]|eukprot:XP_015662779.1 hypothetical protein ABB37_02344 [Leptomonas pyrrhocoris]